MEDEKAKPNEMTIDAFVKLFFTNFQFESKDQLKNMVIAARNFCRCFNDTESEIQKLQDLQFKPIEYIIKNDPELFKEKQGKRLLRVKLRLGKIEHVYYRDGKRNRKLKHMYFLDEDKPKIRKYYSLGEIIDIRDFIKDEVSRIFTDVAIKNSVDIDPFLMQFGQPQPNQEGII